MMLAGTDFSASFLDRFSAGARIDGPAGAGGRGGPVRGANGEVGRSAVSSPPTVLVPSSRRCPAGATFYDLSGATDEAPDAYFYYNYYGSSSSKRHPPRTTYGAREDRSYR
jgi:hypothetical protein